MGGKGKKKIRARGTKQSLSLFCWSRKHGAATVPTAPARTASNKYDRPSFIKAYRNQALWSRGSCIPALEKEVEHRRDFQTTLIIGSQKPDRTAHPQRSPLSFTMFTSDTVPLNVALETTQGLNLPINICSQQGCCSEPSSHLF